MYALWRSTRDRLACSPYDFTKSEDSFQVAIMPLVLCMLNVAVKIAQNKDMAPVAAVIIGDIQAY